MTSKPAITGKLKRVDALHACHLLIYSFIESFFRAKFKYAHVTEFIQINIKTDHFWKKKIDCVFRLFVNAEQIRKEL